ncbi:hypothetical protein EV359DRAFT_68853 [Lentinula novae-zelandiae]|nr:hypothetical protein EV359DRAFT_68853 [Lentinula novae-zelandiae]
MSLSQAVDCPQPITRAYCRQKEYIKSSRQILVPHLDLLVIGQLGKLPASRFLPRRDINKLASLKCLHPTVRQQFEELESALGDERRDWQKRVQRERANTMEALRHFDRLSAYCSTSQKAWQEDRKVWKAKIKSLQQDMRALELAN